MTETFFGVDEMTIRRNADGQQNLVDLRKALGDRSDVSVRSQGGNWIVSVKGESCWHENTMPYHYTERQAIQWACLHARYTVEQSQDIWATVARQCMIWVYG